MLSQDAIRNSALSNHKTGPDPCPKIGIKNGMPRLRSRGNAKVSTRAPGSVLAMSEQAVPCTASRMPNSVAVIMEQMTPRGVDDLVKEKNRPSSNGSQ